MSQSDRPPLGAYAYEEIATKCHEYEKGLLKALSKLRVEKPFSILGPSPEPLLPPPKQPEHVRQDIRQYAGAMFRVEASEYPAGPELEFWLTKLSGRVVEKVMKIAASQNEHSIDVRSMKQYEGLLWHGLTLEDMRSAAEEGVDADRSGILQRSQSSPVQQEIKRPAPSAAPAKPPATPSLVPLVKDQIAELIEATRLTNEQIAEGVGLNERTPYRHISGEVIPGKKTIAKYEQFFSKQLGKPVRIHTPPKRQ